MPRAYTGLTKILYCLISPEAQKMFHAAMKLQPKGVSRSMYIDALIKKMDPRSIVLTPAVYYPHEQARDYVKKSKRNKK